MNSPRPEPALRPPRLLLSRWTGLIAAVILIVPFFVPIPLALRRHPVISPLGDQMHVVLLAAITLMLYWRGPLTGRLLRAVLAAAFIGGAIEFIQIPFKRQANLGDFGLDLVGIGIVCGWVLWRGMRRRAGLWLVIVLLMLIPWRLREVPFVAAAAYEARSLYPVLADLEGPHDKWLWGSNWSTVTIEQVPDSPDGPGGVVRVTASASDHWPGAEMRRFPHDWSAYGVLAMDVRLVSGPADSLRIGVRLDDFVGRRETTWIANRFDIGADWTTVRIPLRDREVGGSGAVDGESRLFDLTDVDRLLVYLSRPDTATVFEIDNVRLQNALN